MSMPAAALMIFLLGIVLWIVTSPLHALPQTRKRRAGQRADLEAQREAKYQEIRDAEMDFQTGKLSVRDHEAVDGALRREALGILDQISALEQVEEAERAGTATS